MCKIDDDQEHMSLEIYLKSPPLQIFQFTYDDKKLTSISDPMLYPQQLHRYATISLIVTKE